MKNKSKTKRKPGYYTLKMWKGRLILVVRIESQYQWN
jgi:hypothetical protein